MAKHWCTPAADSHGARLHHHSKGMWPGRNLWSPLPPISFLGNRETGTAAPAEPLNHVPHIESPATVPQASTSTSKEQAMNIAGNHVRCCGDSKGHLCWQGPWPQSWQSWCQKSRVYSTLLCGNEGAPARQHCIHGPSGSTARSGRSGGAAGAIASHCLLSFDSSLKNRSETKQE